jgi:hypothetical protein
MRFFMSISGFINRNYNVVYKGVNVNTEDFSNVNEFLLGDNHESAGHSEINSLFINTFSNKSDVVLVEAIGSMQQIKRDEAVQSVWLITPAQIIGWDTGTVEEMSGSTLFQQTGNLEIQTQILLRQLLDPNFTGNKEKVKLELDKTIIKTMSLLPEFMKQIKDLEETVVRILQGRVKSMEDSLIKVKETSSRTFLIAGENHLIQENTEDSRCSLESFHEFLNNRNVVVLFPKSEKAQEMGAKRNAIIMEAFDRCSIEA